MNGISSSIKRYRNQRERYIQSQQKRGKPVSEDYLKLFETMEESHKTRFDDPESRKNNLEYDLLTTEWILKKVRNSEQYAQNLYAAMCNTDFIKKEILPILKNETWSCTWRYAGGIIADMREEGDYMDWYCSGISGGDEPDVYLEAHDLKHKLFVPEGVVTDEIREDLDRLGWAVREYKE